MPIPCSPEIPARSRKPELHFEPSFSQAVLDALPLMVLAVDEDVRVVAANAAALAALGDFSSIYLKRGGDVFQCLHRADSPEGCGRGPECKDCLIRNSVAAAFLGTKTFRARCRMEVRTPAQTREMGLLVTTTPLTVNGARRALVVLEDISDLLDLQQLIPICCSCKSIRNDRRYWAQVEDYLAEHLDLQFTHSLCPDCVRRLYPELVDSLPGPGAPGPVPPPEGSAPA